MTQWSKKACISTMRSTIISKASQDEQQNQTKTTNINVGFLLKWSKWRQIKLKINKLTCTSFEKI